MSLTVGEVEDLGIKAADDLLRKHIEKKSYCIHEAAGVVGEASALLLSEAVEQLAEEEGEVKAVQWLATVAETLSHRLHHSGIHADIRFTAIHQTAEPKKKRKK